ncbi:urease accessory protein UreF [Rubrobacter indicoceani]|uniref:urease accessory protein UreF n=1 Tax=Rubrobacter indicoceani TaxID=2051957 RepID=UPI000E5A8F41|nr:urease accessory UreF family protein [Rubrobacter indicoceani]
MTPGLKTSVLLAALQLSDTAFPTGVFAHSFGLEACREAGELRDEADLRRLVGLYLASLATSDCVALRVAYGADALEQTVQADRLLAATKATRELREANARTGRQFLRSFAALGAENALLEGFRLAAKRGETPGSYAVGYALAARSVRVPEEGAVAAYLFSSAASLVAAGQKLIPLGGSAAQRVLFGLRGGIETAAESSRAVGADGMYSFAPTLDVRSAQHERQQTRLYIS